MTTITEADVRLFTTLARFDAVYHGHFKANRNKLIEMPALWGYARDLFQTPGFGDTVDFEQIKQHYYVVHKDINPTQIVPKGPDLAGWLTPHGREDLGGRPFGDGTPPPAPRDDEVVAAEGGRPEPSRVVEAPEVDPGEPRARVSKARSRRRVGAVRRWRRPRRDRRSGRRTGSRRGRCPRASCSRASRRRRSR